MGFLDKVKSGAEQAFEKAKDVAQEGYEKAKDEARELQLKREMGNVHEDLGKKVVELYATGALSHPDLSAGVQRVAEIKDEIAALNAPDPVEPDGGEQAPPPSTPSA